MTGTADCCQCWRIANGLALGDVDHQLAVYESLLQSQHLTDAESEVATL